MIKNPFKYPLLTWPLPANYDAAIPLEEAKKLWKKNKIIPPHLEDVFYSVMTAYPEMKETYFIVVETKFYGTKHALRAYPPLLSLPNKRRDRVYPVVINTDKSLPYSFYEMTDDEKRGVLAHELAHTVDYMNRTSPAILGACWEVWLSKKFVQKLEQVTDRTAILRGYGKFLEAYRKRVLAAAEEKYRNDVQSTYLTPEEIAGQSTKEKDLGGHSLAYRMLYATRTALSFFPAIGEMMYLVYIKKIHKKPNWYNE